MSRDNWGQSLGQVSLSLIRPTGTFSRKREKGM